MAPRRLYSLDPAERRRLLLRTGLVVAVAWALLLLAYTAVGLTELPGLTVPAVLLGSAVFVVALFRQLRAVRRSEVPEVRAIQALGCLVPLHLVLFAGVYVSMPDGSFSADVDHVRAFYFTVTVFATVGFGDITPATDPARVLVTFQMILNLVVLGALARLIVQVAHRRLEEGDAGEVSGARPDG